MFLKAITFGLSFVTDNEAKIETKYILYLWIKKNLGV
jgi:hypothetical protein